MSRSLALALLGLVLTLSSARAQSPDANPFGVVEAFWLPDDACALGAGWERIIFSWAQHQPGGPDDWHTLNVDDRWLAAARACDREVVALLKDTPAWATDGMAGPGVPHGLDLPLDDPGNVWANFVRRAAAYYAERGVRRFIVGNEPDIPHETYGFEFEGTAEDYAAMLRVAFLAAREGNPDARVHVAGVTYWHDVNAGRRVYLDRLLEILTRDPGAAEHGAYFDAVSLHIYFRTDTVYQIVGETRALLDRYGLPDKEIWLDETNASPNLDPAWPVERPRWQVTLDQQGAFLVQSAALALAAGADYVGVYKFWDWTLPPGAEAFGLIRADGSRRPAWDAWRAVIAHFQGVEGATLAQSDTADVVRLRHAGGDVTLVAWARTAAPVVLWVGATDAQSTSLDPYGKMVTLAPVRDGYTLVLPGAVCTTVDGCPVGGLPALLVQPAGAAAVEEITSNGPRPLVFPQEQVHGRR